MPAVWRSLNRYGIAGLLNLAGLHANAAKRLKELDGENARLKRMSAEVELDELMLKEIAKGNSGPEAPTPRNGDAV